MKRGLIILLFLGLSWGSVFGDEETINYSACIIDQDLVDKGINDKEKLLKYIKENVFIKENVKKYINCFSPNEEYYTDLLDMMFFDFLDSLIAWTDQSSDIDVILLGEEGIDLLNKYKDTYDNYNFYLSRYSLYLANIYELDIYPSQFVPDLEKSKKYLKIYEKYKTSDIKRIMFLLIDTDLSLKDRNYIDKKIDKAFGELDENLSKLDIDTQNKTISDLINKSKTIIQSKEKDTKIYILSYLKFLLQKKLFINIVSDYNNNDFSSVIKNFRLYLNDLYFTDIYFKNQLFNKGVDLLFASYKWELESYLSKNDYQNSIKLLKEIFIELNKYGTTSNDIHIDNKKYFNNHYFYFKNFSCAFGKVYDSIGEKEKSVEYLTYCDDNSSKNPSRGGLLLGR